MSEAIEFLASMPPIQTAIKVAGDGGARVQLDIPETELPAIARLLLMRGKVLRVRVEAERAEPSEQGEAAAVRGWRERRGRAT